LLDEDDFLIVYFVAQISNLAATKYTKKILNRTIFEGRFWFVVG